MSRYPLKVVFVPRMGLNPSIEIERLLRTSLYVARRAAEKYIVVILTRRDKPYTPSSIPHHNSTRDITVLAWDKMPSATISDFDDAVCQ